MKIKRLYEEWRNSVLTCISYPVLPAFCFVLISSVGFTPISHGDSHLPLSVGMAKIDITPSKPIRLSGFGGRRHPSEGVSGKLWAKALAIDDGTGPSFIVTLDLVGIPAWLTSEVKDSLKISASDLALCATHTHSGPHLKGVLDPIFMDNIPDEHQEVIDQYSSQLAAKVALVCRMASNNQKHGKISWAQGKVGFASNRRVIKDGFWAGFGVQSNGPVDHSLPVLKIEDSRGAIMGVLVSYACHCTTLGGDYNHIHGDWAGEAQRLIEKRLPGSIAMVAIGCGGDSNPYPRGSISAVYEHGSAVANEVDRVLSAPMKELISAPHTQLDFINLPLDPHPDREFWENKLKLGGRIAYYASRVLGQLDRGEPLPQSINYPVQTWTFGEDLAMVFLAGEVVVDYSVKLKERFDGDRLWINAYANASPSYIASRRLYDEGGYEVDRSMYNYDLPVRLSPDTEDLVLDEVLQQLPYHFYSEQTLARIPAPVSKENALSTMVGHKDLWIELVAAEPLIMDPIDIAWGPDGRLWVVEMGDYPLGVDGNGSAGGRVRILDDGNGDGIFDESQVFLDGLLYPTSVFPWREGALIVTGTDLIYARDTNQDDKADESIPLYTDFTIGNQQHLVNGMQWGLDGWIYLANGGTGGIVHSVIANRSVDITNRDLKILPQNGSIEALPGPSQFGRNRDSWGNWFGSNNSRPGWHYALDDTYLRRNPFVQYPENKKQLFEPPVAPPVYPVSVTLSRYNDYDRVNRYTGISGFMIYEDQALGDAFYGNGFLAECVHNTVSRFLVYPEGSTFSSKRAPEEIESEFLASTDNWFRPTSIRSGPDGALYIVDMYRLVIEHPKWIPEDWQRKLNLREGHDKGRIYKVTGKEFYPKRIPDLTHYDSKRLVEALDSGNRWQRDSSHQLLIWKPDPSVLPALRRVACEGRYAAGRAQAFWVLHQWNALDEKTLLCGLNDQDPGVRMQAAKLSENQLDNDSELLGTLIELINDPEEKVRMQVAYSLGASHSDDAAIALGQLARKNLENPLMLAAILSSSIEHQVDVAESCSELFTHPEGRTLLRYLTQTAIGSNNPATAQIILKSILGSNGISDIRRMEVILDFLQVLRKSGTSLDTLGFYAVEGAQGNLSRISDLFENARSIAHNSLAESNYRITAVNLIPFDRDNRKENLSVLLELLQPSVPVSLQLEAVDGIIQAEGSQSVDLLLRIWSGLGPKLRTKILSAFINNEHYRLLLLQKAQGDSSIVASFSNAQISELARDQNKRIRGLADKLFGQRSVSSRNEIVRQYEPALQLQGDPIAGRIIFAALCSACHKIGGLGFQVGPDLNALTDKSPRSMLIAILDPNRVVEAKYLQYAATGLDGTTTVGVISEESSTSITLISPGGLKQTLLRNNLKSIDSYDYSLMPEGLENGLDHQEMADLIGFLYASDETLKIRADADGSYSLTAANGIVSGSSAYFNAKIQAIEGIAENDAIQWTVYDLKAGSYDIFSDAAMAMEYEGRPFMLTVNDALVTGAVVYTGDLTYFRKRKFGNLKVEQDIPIAEFKLVHSLKGPQLSLKELKLVPIN